MARKRISRSTGVGRGNGAGSRQTQFKDGMPSGNPVGRPRKPKRSPNSSIKDAVQRTLAQLITTVEDGVEARRSQTDAMVMLLAAQYPRATIREKIAILRYLGEIAPEALNDRPPEDRSEGLKKLVAWLAEEAERSEGVL